MARNANRQWVVIYGYDLGAIAGALLFITDDVARRRRAGRWRTSGTTGRTVGGGRNP
jgi:hypothetical protein